MSSLFSLFRGDFVVFDMLFQELVISKSMYNNLIAEVDEFNDLVYIDNCSELSSAKLCNCDVGETSSKNVKSFKRFISKEMINFNIKMESNDYFK